VSIEISGLWVRILENIRKMKTAIFGGSTRRKWGLEVMKRDQRVFVRKCCGFSELKQMEGWKGNWMEKQEKKYVSLYIIVKLWWKVLHMRQKELLAKIFLDVSRQYGNLVGGEENVSVKAEIRFERNLVECMW
jgi:hypothetical protein